MRAMPDHGTPVEGVTAVEAVFCLTCQNIVELDCIDASGPGAGEPFTMRLGLPARQPWSAAAERALMRWAAHSAVVSVELRNGRGPRKVRLMADGTAILLEQVGAGFGLD